RTLIESVCKHILDAAQVEYDDAADLPKLYKLTAETLNLAPSQHTEAVSKQVLGGCTAVVEGLGSLRNRLSDAHGKGKVGSKPAPRHAELAVNLSGALATYLLATWEARNEADAYQFIQADAASRRGLIQVLGHVKNIVIVCADVGAVAKGNFGWWSS